MGDLFKKIKSSICELILSSTCHGLPSFIRTRRPFFKIMWFIFFLTASGVCCYLISNTFISFFSYDFVTKIDIIHENPMQFPTVVFCNLNPKSKQYNLNETIINCRFGADVCDETDFTWYYDIRYGYCFVFNHVSLKNSTMAGYYNGLQLKIFTDPINDVENAPSSNGFHLYVYNYSKSLDLNLGVDIPTGSEARISLYREQSEKLGYPFNNCINDLNSIDSYDSDIYKEIFKSNFTYSQNSCFNNLALKQIGLMCNCSAPLSKLMQSCSNKDIICLRTSYAGFFNQKTYDELSKQCPLDCKSIDFKLIQSLGDLDYLKVRDFINLNSFVKNKYQNRSLSYDVLKKTTLVVTIYYEDLTYTMITQTPKINLIDLVSNIGGLLGLFIGTSFLSFAELIEIILEVLFILFEYKSNKVHKLKLDY